MSRIIILGDIHGCVREFEKLLKKIHVQPQDRLISVGDLICKGPYSRETLELAQSLPNLTCLVGNHELRFLACWKKGKIPDIKPYDRKTWKSLGKKYTPYMKWISSWPYWISLQQHLVVHAGIRPGIPLHKQSRIDLTTLRYILPEDRPWYELYRGKKTVVFGHWVRKKTLVRKNAVGIDTGCVYGGKLTAYLLPEKQLVSVKARRNYSSKESLWA